MTKEAYERRKAYQREFQRRQKDPALRTLKETPMERAARRKAAGQCTQCGEPREEGLKCLCAGCQEQRNKRQQERRARCVATNLCTVCQKPHTTAFKLCPECRKNVIERHKQGNAQLKQEIFAVYGTKCACCGEDHPLLLNIDHINNDGAAHRRSLKSNKRLGGQAIYRWLKNNNYPPGFQVLCWNCNMGKHLNGGVCPHKEKENA